MVPILFGLSPNFIWGDTADFFNESLFLFFFLDIVKGSEHIAHKVLKSLQTADRYLGNALRIKR